MKDIVFFLGANSYKGFYSLYSDFPGVGEFLHIIKGGPGTGKSGYMKALYERARMNGMDCERILCSGDPNSLDGLRVPQLSAAWADGTSPHVLEPDCFGVSGNYVNIGRFCSTPLRGNDSHSAENLTKEYKLYYRKAYTWLNAAKMSSNIEADGDKSEELKENIDLLNAAEAVSGKRNGSLTRRFISAESCLGHIVLKETLDKLCKHCYVAKYNETLDCLSEYARMKGYAVTMCPVPREPELTEAVLIPEIDIAFISGRLLSGEVLGDFSDCGIITRPEYSSEAEGEFMELAWDSLRKAKLVHDELEGIYKRYMNFDALTDVTDKQAKRLFG